MIVAMMTRELEVSILAAPLVQMDRGALSQAWYTALRLGLNAQPGSPRDRATQPLPVVGVRHSCVEKRATLRSYKPASSAATALPARRVAIGLHDMYRLIRPARRATLAERIERAFAGAPQPAKRATFSLGRGNARVHIVLQTIGERPTLLALCRPEMRTVVGRALAQARLALARRGIGVDLCALGEVRNGGCQVCF